MVWIVVLALIFIWMILAVKYGKPSDIEQMLDAMEAEPSKPAPVPYERLPYSASRYRTAQKKHRDGQKLHERILELNHARGIFPPGTLVTATYYPSTMTYMNQYPSFQEAVTLNALRQQERPPKQKI